MPVDWGEKFAWLIEVMKPYYAQKMKYGTGVITRIQEENNNSGRVNGAYATIDGDVDQFVDLSMNQGIQKNDVIVFSKDENMINSEWKPHKILRSRQAVSAPNVNRKFMPPVVSGADVIVAPGLGGVVSVPDTDPTDDPTGVLQAAAYIHFLAISQEQYNAYDYGYTGVKIRYRVVGETDPGTGQQVDWKKELSFPLTPKEVNTVLLDADINNSATGSIAITIPDRFLTTILRNTACWWKIGEEIVLASIPSGADTAINVIARAQLGTSAVAHLTGETIVLLSSRLLLENLRPSSASEDIVYQYQLAFYDNFNVPGMWSDVYSFTSYKITAPPAAPASLTVTITRDGYKLAWPKVPNQHVKQYRVYRYTSNPANGGGDANYSSAQGMPGTSNARVGNVNQVNWPVDQYTGDGKAAKYFCVVAEDDTGNLSVATAWTTDVTAPPSPNPTYVTIEATAEGPKIIIANAETSDRDEGFSNWVLWQATNTSGGSKAIVARFKDREFTYTADPAGTQYYQVTSEDLIGNNGTTTDNATYWKRDDGSPSAPSGLAVTAVQGGFMVKWTVPAYASLKNIDYYIVRRSDGVSSSLDKKVEKHFDNVFWPAMEVPVIANVLTYQNFYIEAVDYNGTHSGFSGAASDTTAPPSPSAANVLITSDRGGVKVTIAAAETPQLDDSWKEYVVRYSTDGSTDAGILHAFDGKSTIIPVAPYTNNYYQVCSRDWVNNAGAANGSNWVRAQSLYPTDPRQLLPANGDLQEINPSSPTLPNYWGFTGVNGSTSVITSYPISTISHIKTGGSLDSAYVGGLLGAGVGSGTSLSGLHTATLFPYNQRKTYDLTGWILLPVNILNGATFDVLVDLLAYNNPNGTGTPNVYHHVLRYTNSSGGTVVAGTWVPSDITTFVPNVAGTYARLVFMAMYNSAGTNLNGTTWGLDDILLDPKA